MPVRLEPACTCDLDAIASLLTAAFNAPPDASFVDRDLLRWKYFESFGPGSLPRSYVLKLDDTILAHCMAGPLTLRAQRWPPGRGPTTRVSAVCFQDWAAGRRLPGAGVILLKKLAACADVAIVAGGSAASRHAIPTLGFRLRDTISVYARVVRPLQQARSRPASGTFKGLARFCRNSIWSTARVGAIAKGWRAERVDAFAALSDEQPSATMPAEHAPQYLNYWLRCPAARIIGFEIRHGADRRGHFLLSHVRGQTRIATLRLTAGVPEDWQHGLRLAVHIAADDPATSEILCLASTPLMQAALDACGFRQRGTVPLFLRDPEGKLASAPPISWSAIDDDTAYVYDAANPYRT